MSKRSVWKIPFVEKSLIKKVKTMMESSKKLPIKTYSRRSTIIPMFVGYTFDVYNGKKFIPVLVSEGMVGHKFGEFSPTRTFTGHSGNRKADVTATKTDKK